MQQQQKPKERNAYCFSTITFESPVSLLQSVQKYLKLSCLFKLSLNFSVKIDSTLNKISRGLKILQIKNK